MRISHEARYDAPVDQVRAMMLDPEFRTSVCAAQHVVRHTVAVSDTRVEITQVHAADRIPAFARKLVGDEIKVVQIEDWAAPDRASIEVTIPGKPGNMVGTASLAADGTGTVETVELDVKVSIPLVGGKIERLIAELLEKALAKEYEIGRAWLAGSH